MAKFKKIQFFSARPNSDGTFRYYWQPSANLRRQGFKLRALSPCLEQAQKEAISLNAEIQAWKMNNPDVNLTQKPRRAAPVKGSFNALIMEKKADRKYLKLSPKTRYGYERSFEFLLKIFGGEQVASIRREEIENLYDSLLREKGVFVANGHIKVLSLLLNFGVRKGYILHSPMTLFDLEKAPHRKTLWSDEAFNAFIETAKRERPSVALAAMLSRWTAQRRGDVLKMKWSDIVNGHIVVHQNKTGVEVHCPLVPQLAEMLNSTAKDSVFIVTSETTRQPYKADNFSRNFRRILNKAIEEHPDIDFKNMLLIDFRRTLITDMGDSSCSDAEMRSVSGHSGNSRILNVVYRQNTETQADNAISKVLKQKFG
jgi:integrase